MNSGRKVEDIMQEAIAVDRRSVYINLRVIDLSKSNSDFFDTYGFTAPEWMQMQQEFLARISPLKCKLAEPYVLAMKFLCKVFSFTKNLSTSFELKQNVPN